MVGPGVAASIYIDDTAVETVRTTQALLPGRLEHFSYSWKLPPEMDGKVFSLSVTADDVGDGSGEHNECEQGGEDNNAARIDGLSCGTVD
jgi:hypothetical protein